MSLIQLIVTCIMIGTEIAVFICFVNYANQNMKTKFIVIGFLHMFAMVILFVTFVESMKIQNRINKVVPKVVKEVLKYT